MQRLRVAIHHKPCGFKEFSAGSFTIYSSEKSKPAFCFTAYSYKRQEAEKFLSGWDGRTTNITRTSAMEMVEGYHYLGTVKGQVLLKAAPKKGDGTLRLYLIPAAIPLEKWSASQPEQYLIADLDEGFPVEFENGKTSDFPLTRTVDFMLSGVTTGNYRLKVVWNKTPPWTKTETVVCLPHSGDFENTSSSEIAIQQGQVLEGIQIECTTPAGSQRNPKQKPL